MGKQTYTKLRCYGVGVLSRPSAPGGQKSPKAAPNFDNKEDFLEGIEFLRVDEVCIGGEGEENHSFRS